MNTSDELFSMLDQIGDRARRDIVSHMVGHKATSLNVREYFLNCEITNYTFYDCDRHNFGMVMSLDGLIYENQTLTAIFIEENSGEKIEKEIHDVINDEEKVYILRMVEEIFDLVDAGEPLIPIGKDYYDMVEGEE